MCPIAHDCKFGDTLEEKLCDHFVTGINDPRMTKNLMMISEDKLDLQKATDTCIAMEMADKQAKELEQQREQNVDSLAYNTCNPGHRDNRYRPQVLHPRLNPLNRLFKVLVAVVSFKPM